jgi:phosphoribosylformimino-5-aminoimidazole carboxamide ribotide isomerase
VRIIGVIDVLDGVAMHAVRGLRQQYEPVPSVGGDPLALARAYTAMGVHEIYVADLDAIRGNGANDGIASSIATVSQALWLDAGVSSVGRARHALALGAARVVVGLETLSSYAALALVCADIGDDHVAFSLDLMDGVPILLAEGGSHRDREAHKIILEPPAVMAARAVDAGASAIIVLDLARVGSDEGLDFDLIARIREAVPQVTLVAGGGVRGDDDLARLADAGCDGALVATALQNGALRDARASGHGSATR